MYKRKNYVQTTTTILKNDVQKVAVNKVFKNMWLLSSIYAKKVI